MRASFISALLLIFGWCLSNPVLAQEGDCANPRESALSLLDSLQRGNWNPAAAARCMQLPTGREADGPQLAVQTKQVLDSNGWYVPTAQMSVDPDYKDATGAHRAVPLERLPSLVIHKVDGRWLWSQDFVSTVPALYTETYSPLLFWVHDKLPESFFQPAGIFQIWQYLWILGLILASILAALAVQSLLADQVVRYAKRAGVKLPDEVVAKTRGPVTWLVMGAVFLWGIPNLQAGVNMSRWALFAASTVLSLATVLILARSVDVATSFLAQRAAATKSRLDDQVIPLVNRAAKATVWVLGAVFVVQNMGVDVGSLIAGLGIGGLAFALAAKDTVENLFGSMTIFTDRPFQIGDWIVIDGNIEGVVEEVGFRSTRIRTFSGSIVCVPNGKVANSRIENVGVRPHRRYKVDIGLEWRTPPDRIEAYVAGLKAYLATNPAVADTTCMVHFTKMGDSSLGVMAYFFFDVPDWAAELDAKQACNLAFLRLAQEHGVSFAFPSQSLYIEKMPN